MTTPAGRCPECRARLPAQAVLCIHCGYDLRTKRPRATQSGGTIVVDPDAEAHRPFFFKEYVVPLSLLAAGLAAGVAAAWSRFGALGAGAFFTVVAVRLIIALPVAVGGMYLVGSMLGISYGLLRPAVLKLAGTAVAVRGAAHAADWGVAALGWPWMIPALVLLPLLPLVLFRWLFELAWDETLFSVLGLAVLAAAIHAAASWLLGWLL
jgi:hypothetical protein